MPALSSFITYRPGKKAKAAIKSHFSLLRGDNSTTSSTTSQQQYTTADVIDINNSRYSLDFDGGKPSDSFEQDVFDDPRSSELNLTTGTSPQVELDIDLSSNVFSDWLEAFSGPNAKQEAIASHLKRLTRLKNSVSLNTKREESKEGEANGGQVLASSSEDIPINFRAIDASHLDALLEHDDVSQGTSSPNSLTSNPITMPDGSAPNNGQSSRPTDLSIGTSMTSRPLSSQSDTTAFSALSGTTLARALMSNSFILSTDRSSRYLSGIGAGLTRSDSTTLPFGERNPFAMFDHDRFSIGPDAPPIPLNAEFLYEPPRISRNEERRSKRSLRRRSSTGSLSPKLSPETPSISSNIRPNSVIISADVDFDPETILPKTPPRVKPSMPRSPLPHIPTPRQTIDEAMTPDQASTPSLSFQEVTQQLPMHTQLSPDFNTLSPDSSSEGHTSPRELEGLLLNYYSIPDSPEMSTAGGGFRPIFSPISEELSSQLSPPGPYRVDRRDSQRSQPVGARSPLSGSLRVRGDSMLSPRKDQLAGPRPQILPPVGEGAQSKIAPDSSTSTDSEFYFTGDDDPDSPLSPPQLSKVFNRQRSGSAPSPIRVMRDSRDMNAYDIRMTSRSGAPTPFEEGIVSQEFPETPDAFSPMFSAGPNPSPGITLQSADGQELSPTPTTPMSAAILGRSNSHSVLAAQLLLNRASVRHSRRSLSKIGTTTIARSGSGSPSNRIADISESPEAYSSTLSPTAGDATTEETPQLSSSEPSASQSTVSLSVDASRSPSLGTNNGQDTSDMYASSVEIDSTSRPRMKSLPAIPISSPIVPPSPDHESPPLSLPESSTAPTFLAEPIVAPPSPTPSQAAKLAALRGRLPPPALTISKHTSVLGPDGPVAVNGTDPNEQDSPELQQPQLEVPEGVTPATSNSFPVQSSLNYKNDTFRGRVSDIFRGTSLGSPPPYYSVVSETFMHDNQSPHFTPPSFRPQGPDNVAGPSSTDISNDNDNGRNLGRENSLLSQRARIRPPLPAGPRRPSQQFTSSSGSVRERPGSVSSVASSSLTPDSRARPSTRYNNSVPSPSFQTPTPKWRGYTMEVAKWTFTSAQLQAIVSRAIRQSAEASSIRLLRLEVLDNEIPEEIQRLVSQRTDIIMRYKALARRRAGVLDLLHASLNALEDGNSTHRLLRQLDELKEVAQSLDRLAEEIHSVDQQVSYLESLTHIHTGSALAMALRKLNSSFLKQVAENQVLRSQIQSLEAERDEAWQQAQNVANEYDQISDNISSPSKRSSRVSAIRKTRVRVSRAGLRTPTQRLSQRSSVGSGAATSFIGSKSPPVPPLPKWRPMDISIDSPVRSSAAMSTSGVTPTSESRALAKAQDELYAMLGILNPERSLHRTRSECGPGSPAAAATSRLRSPQFGENSWRRSSLPGALSLTEAYNVMAADRNAVLATIDMLSATE
ncbi:hypothetical protein BYT27DRAFT_7135848 [Phlegmacium glaucopus]|nr:hypothetical protein BYT27DRAFT_7135848 [Phlegmacium glaucopus]